MSRFVLLSILGLACAPRATTSPSAKAMKPRIVAAFDSGVGSDTRSQGAGGGEVVARGAQAKPRIERSTKRDMVGSDTGQ